MNAIFRFIVCLVLVAVVLAGFAFSGFNTIEVPLWLGVELPPQRLAVWIAISFAAGALIGLLLGFGLFKRIKSRLKVKQLESHLKQAQKQIERLQSEAAKPLVSHEVD